MYDFYNPFIEANGRERDGRMEEKMSVCLLVSFFQWQSIGEKRHLFLYAMNQGADGAEKIDGDPTKAVSLIPTSRVAVRAPNPYHWIGLFQKGRK